MLDTNLENLLSNLGFSPILRRGSNLMSCCPNHPERRPSWGISIHPPHMHGCFGCGYKGSLQTLLRDKFNWSAQQLKELGLDLVGGEESLNFRGRDAFVGEARFVNEQELWPFAMEPKGLKYLAKRGINQKTIKQAGLLYHRLDDRIIFPWRINGKLVGMTGRACFETEAGDKIKAYCGLKKSNWVYIPDKGYLDEDSPLIICEGEIDALKLLQAGFDNVCALGHGQVSSKQAAFLKSLLVKNFILFFDNDRRGTELAAEMSEQFFGFSLKTVDWKLFPNVKDPGAMTASQLTKAIKTAKPLVSWPSF